jgi:1-acyl-sn-glycerol-3-phosphate acyltransferase
MAELMFRQNFLLTFLLKILGGIRVDRNSHDYSFVSKCCKILEKGGVIEIYPEARIPQPGEETPLPFKSSAAYIALESGAPIIPVYNEGKYFKLHRNKVIIGTPIDVRELYDNSMGHTENLENISKILRQRVIELKDELEEQTKAENKK